MKKADPKGEGPNRRGGAAIIAAAASLLCGVGTANAQDLEPRAYAASPIGTNFLVSGFGNTSGAVSFDPSLPITGVKAAIDSYNIGYDHTFDLLGRAASAAIVVPYIDGELKGQVYTQSQRVTRSGQGDVRISAGSEPIRWTRTHAGGVHATQANHHTWGEPHNHSAHRAIRPAAPHQHQSPPLGL